MLEREGAAGPTLEHATHGMRGASMPEQSTAATTTIANPQFGCDSLLALVATRSEPGSVTTWSR
jgi:hypothetical protein